jgi:Putative Ig domain
MVRNAIWRGPFRPASLVVLLIAVAIGVPVAFAGPGECMSGTKRWGCASRGANDAPTISGTPPAEVAIGQSYSFTPAASDPEGRTLAFYIANRPAWASFSTATGRLSGTPGSSAAGEYVDIVISVTDGKLSSSLPPFSIVVSQANRAPSIGGTPPTAAREGQVYEFRPTAADPDGDPLTFTIANKPAWATFSSTTGVLRGTPGSGSAGTYPDISIRVSDGRLAASLPAYTIGVQQTSMGSATLSWTVPTVREDGTPLTGLAGYRIYYGTAAGSYPNRVQIANPGVTSHMITNLPAGTYYFVATAYDSAGRESNFSGVVSKTIG